MAKANNHTTPKTNSSFTCHFKVEKETKGTFKYQQVKPDGSPHTIDGGAQIGSLYIRKSAFGDAGGPAKITITVEKED
jgi:hypothetical protein